MEVDLKEGYSVDVVLIITRRGALVLDEEGAAVIVALVTKAAENQLGVNGAIATAEMPETGL